MAWDKMFAVMPTYTPAEVKEILSMRRCGCTDYEILKSIHNSRLQGIEGFGVAEPVQNYNSAGIRKIAGAPRKLSDIKRAEKLEQAELRKIAREIRKIERAEKAPVKRVKDPSSMTLEQREKLIQKYKAEIAALMGEAEAIDISGKVFDKE
jgi:hypothetical protein